MNSVVLVGGPTASGKSALAVELALALGGEVVNIDSVQCYRGAEVGAATATAAEQRGVPHHLLGCFDPQEQVEAAEYARLARSSIDDIASRGRTPVLVGGTGMYLRALFHGLADLPKADPAFRAEAEKRSSAELHAELQRIDPVSAARLHPNDRQRVTRALETYQLTGKPLSAAHLTHAHADTGLAGVMVVLCWSREELYRRIDERSARMVDGGLIEETERIRAESEGRSPILKSLGYSHALQFLTDQLSRSELSAAIAQDTRRFAKRQMTFWRNEPGKRGWLAEPSPADADSIVAFDLPHKRRNQEGQGFPVFSWDRRELLRRVGGCCASKSDGIKLWYIDAAALGPLG